MSTSDPESDFSRGDLWAVGRALVRWYRQAARDLPWRRTADPYAVLVSETMLQQTQVRTVEMYFRRWMERFPDVTSLARADIGDVLRLWEGLGYYARARRLQRAAQAIVEEHGGMVPDDLARLSALPGVGEYTAGAVAAIAFNRPAIALDANARRVLQRILGMSASDGVLRNAALQMAPDGHWGDFAQSLFELGATLCTSGSAACGACPVRRFCRAGQSGEPLAYGRSRPGAPVIRLTRAAAIVTAHERMLVVRRRPGGVWGDLWEFPWMETDDAGASLAAAAQAAFEVAGVTAVMQCVLGTVKHSVTRYRVTLNGCWGVAPDVGGAPLTCAEVAWLRWSELENLPMASPQRRLCTMAYRHEHLREAVAT
jgi:A/G-specific adenine glycosylase